jgi:predicted anti-sigma-YlaC factor YlaD
MTTDRCPREDELLDALGRAFVGPELETHIASCPACTDLRSVAGALLDDRAAAMMAAPIPSAGTMWWRMRVRHRQEAEATARRSLLIGQAATLVIAITLLISFFGTDLALSVRHLYATVRVSTPLPLLLGLATWVLLTPIAGWVLIRQK